MSPDQLNLQVIGVKPVRHKPTPAKAAEITKENIHLLADWVRSETGDYWSAYVASHEIVTQVHGKVQVIPRLFLKCDKGQGRVADIGDYLMQGTIGEFYAITPEVYMNSYENVPQEG